MLSFVFTSFCLLAIINKVKSEHLYKNLSLILVNETSSQCYFNHSNSSNSNSKNQSEIHLCLDDKYSYECKNNQSHNDTTLQCSLKSGNNTCHSTFINYNGSNITLDCFYKELNVTLIGNQLSLLHLNECMYGITNPNHSNTLLVCGIFHPLITVTTYNVTTYSTTTQIIQQSARYYKFPLFGFEVTKHLVKKYGILILVAIIVISCLIALCCYGMCHLCCMHMKKNKYNTNQRMPQSANSCDA